MKNSSACPPFADNWSYLKAELQWLDRLLLLAVGKSRRERRELDKVSRSDRDRVTQHWWKGIVFLDGTPLYDDGRPPDAGSSPTQTEKSSRTAAAGDSVSRLDQPKRPAASGGTGAQKQSYQKQIEARIQASRAKGIVLGLPQLCDRLGLTLFEKKLVLLGLAPEVNRRYTRLYRYLQEDEVQELPQVDLALKLLCRNDREWNQARRRLVENSPLVQRGLLDLVAPGEQPLLTHQIKLSVELVNYLLANPIETDALNLLLADYPSQGEKSLVSGLNLRPAAGEGPDPSGSIMSFAAGASATEVSVDRLPGSSPQSGSAPKPSPPPSAGSASAASDPWKPLILPRSLKRELQHLSQRMRLLTLEPPEPLVHPQGTLVLLSGPSGTGKTTAARAIARSAQTGLVTINLATLDALTLAQQLEQWLQQWQRQTPTVLLFRRAEKLLGTGAPVSEALVTRLFVQRRQQPGLTLFSTPLQPLVARSWQRQCDRLLTFPLPDVKTRQRLWKQALSKPRLAGLSLDSRIAFAKLAQQGRLTGAEIEAIARDAVLYAKLDGKSKLTLAYLQRAWQQRHQGR